MQFMNNLKPIAPILKYAGGKRKLLKHLHKYIPTTGDVLIEPFVGGGAFWLSTDYKEYHLADTNPDLINLYNLIKNEGTPFIHELSQLFHADHKDNNIYMKRRDAYNDSKDPIERALLYYWLNRTCFNGLSRYNLSNRFNVPIGDFKTVKFQYQALVNFHEKAQNATFYIEDFQTVVNKLIDRKPTVYLDPPYFDLKKKKSLKQVKTFIGYGVTQFTFEDQLRVADCARMSRESGGKAFISNHFTKDAQDTYKDATKLIRLTAPRSISSKTNQRKSVGEILALYD